jgi:spermidine synthase
MGTEVSAAVSKVSLSTPAAWRLQWIHLIVFASGFAGLGYEMVWTRMLAVSLGHEIIAVLAVLAAFFAGLALGAFSLSNTLRHTQQPQRWYALLEIVIGIWAIALIWLIPAFNEAIPHWIGEQPSPLAHWGIAFGATLFLLLPATAAMGATLPALERIYVSLFGAGRHVGGVYAANTFGAVAGTLLATFVLAPSLGYSLTLGACAIVNFCCAIGIIWLFRRTARMPEDNPAPARPQQRNQWLLASLLLTGFLGLCYEVLVIRVLSQVLEDTVFTFAVVLCIYLLGTASGATVYQRWLAHRIELNALPWLLVATAIACLSGLATLWLSDGSYAWLSQLFERSTLSAISAEITLALMVFLLPTMAMGALFSHLAQTATSQFGLGHALAVNTLGAALAPLLAGVLLLPVIGAKWALLLVALSYLLLLPVWHWRSLRPAVLPIGLAAGLSLMPPLRFVQVPPQGALLDYRDGIMAAVTVVADTAGTRYLKVNNHFTMGSTSSTFADHRQTHLPLLLHAAPRRALFLGVGTGMSLNAAQYHPHLEVTAVELVPETLRLLHHFNTAPEQNAWTQPPRLLASDARRFVGASQSDFDVIIADLFHPSRDGAGSLYTREHFAAIKQRLAPGGLFCQWLPLFQMDLATFKLIARTFLDRFPHVQVHLPHFSLQQPIIGLLGSEQPLRYGPEWLQNRVHSPALQQQLVALRLNSNLALFGGFIADRTNLANFVGAGSLNTDDRPLVTYQAPGFAYRQEQGHPERLVQLVEALVHERGTLLDSSNVTLPQREFAERLSAYWAARDAYLRAGLGISPQQDLHAMLAKIREPLLDVVRISSDFMSAYLPLLTMAQALNQSDPQAARRLLLELDQAAPSRQEARRLLRQLGGASSTGR